VSSYFDYPTEGPPAGDLTFPPNRDEEDWSVVLGDDGRAVGGILLGHPRPAPAVTATVRQGAVLEPRDWGALGPR
jgi:hypothetical protein